MVDRWSVPPEGDSYYNGSRTMARSSQDVFDSSFAKACAAVNKYSGRFKIVKDHSVKAAERFNDRIFDFVFIDGDHSYEGVTADLNAWARKVKPGGWLCGHDWGNNNTAQDVERAVRDFLGERADSVVLSYNNTWFYQLPL